MATYGAAGAFAPTFRSAWILLGRPAMNAAQAFDRELSAHPVVLSLVIPEQLRLLFEESPKMRASFHRLNERDRRGFVRYIEEAKTDATRERRAAIIAMSLMGLANDLNADGSRVDAG